MPIDLNDIEVYDENEVIPEPKEEEEAAPPPAAPVAPQISAEDIIAGLSRQSAPRVDPLAKANEMREAAEQAAEEGDTLRALRLEREANRIEREFDNSRLANQADQLTRHAVLEQVVRKAAGSCDPEVQDMVRSRLKDYDASTLARMIDHKDDMEMISAFATVRQQQRVKPQTKVAAKGTDVVPNQTGKLRISEQEIDRELQMRQLDGSNPRMREFAKLQIAKRKGMNS